MTRKSTEIRQEEIKEAVLKIIRTDGIKAVSTKNIANQTGLSEGAIFRHFKTKRDIILGIISDVSEILIKKLRVIAYSEDSPKDRFHNFLCGTITYLTENNGLTILLFTEASHTNDEEMKEKLNWIFNSQRELVGKIILDGISEGIWSDKTPIDDVTRLYMGVPITHNINLVLSNEKGVNADFCKRMITMFEKILEK
jgi:AcrR family transcriptional regulator